MCVFQFLSGLCLKFNALHNEILPVLCPAIQTLKHLTALDLGCNDLRVAVSPDAAVYLGRMLAELPLLERLDMSNNALRSMVETLLQGIQRPLRFLRLCACLLSVADMQYLVSSHHSQGLQELDISENNLGMFYEVTCDFLLACAPHLAVIELENCRLSESQLENFLGTICCQLQLVKYLNICRNKNLSQNILVPSLPTLAQMPALVAFKVSYPLECYLTHDGDVDAAMDRFHGHMSLLLESLAARHGRDPVELVMECS